MSPFRTAASRNAVLTAALICFFCISTAPNILSQSISTSPPSGVSIAFDHNEKGLQVQYQAFVETFADHAETQAHQAFAIFALPNPGEWFGKYFAKEQVPQLEKDYGAELDAYEAVLLKRLGSVPAGTKFRVHCKVPHPDPAIHMQPRRDAIAPESPIPAEQFVCEFDPVPKLKYGRLSMFVNYVYVDGAFRYVGAGAYPFWSSPDAASQKKTSAQTKS